LCAGTAQFEPATEIFHELGEEQIPMEYPKAAIAREFRSIIRDRLGVNTDQLPGETTLSSLGLDFIAYCDLMELIEDRFNIRVKCKPIDECFTLDESVAWLEDLLNETGAAQDEAILPEGAD